MGLIRGVRFHAVALFTKLKELKIFFLNNRL